MDIDLFEDELMIIIDPEEMKAQLLIDSIIEHASFPSGRWEIPEGVEIIVSN